MKILFAGPSLYGSSADLGDVIVRPPAAHGDLAAAVMHGATAIGLVDGYFEATASVWHKEILFALAEGVRVLGAASMGALRAVECAAYGMEPIGEIAARYATGELDDDAAVALQHGPAELGYMPTTEALVDAEATLANLLARNLIRRGEAVALQKSARTLYFKRRTPAAIAAGADGLTEARRKAVVATYWQYRVSVKTADTLLLLDRLKTLPDRRATFPRTWMPASTPVWRDALAEIVTRQPPTAVIGR